MNRMKWSAAVALVVVVLQGVLAAQNSAASAEKLLARAQHKASIERDLQAAILDYKAAVAAAGRNRALAARALIELAECYVKLGNAEAQTIYERVVRDYADQTEAVGVARARLVARTTAFASATRARGDWSVWAGQDADGFGTISPDGRFLTYTDWANGGNLALRDLAAGTNHQLTSGGVTQFSAISKDGRWVAYEWTDSKVPARERRPELRVARLQRNSLVEPRRVIPNEGVAAVPYDWSPDGKWIAGVIARKEGSRAIGLVSIATGEMRVLKSLDWQEPTKVFFSPDGASIAYDLPANDSTEESHVFIMAVDGSREATAVAHASQNVIMGWSPDGRHVLFSSNRSGSFGLWSVPVDHGKPSGPATLLKADISSSWSLGLTAAGTMYVWKYASPMYVQVSAVDLAAGKLVAGPPIFQRFISSRGRPEWSDDGKYLAYQSCNPLGGGPCTLWIRSMETGQLREVKPKLKYFPALRWSPDNGELVTRGTDHRGRNNGFYRIDTQTGETSAVMLAERGDLQPQWASDGKHILYRRDSALIERNVALGTERELARISTSGAGPIVLSPDKRQIAYLANEPDQGQTLFVMPIEGATPRPLLRVAAPEFLRNRLNWTDEGRALAVVKLVDGRNELWLVPVDGSAPRKLDIDTSNWHIQDGFRFDHTGKHLVFVTASGQPGLEIRALENFLPASPVRRSDSKK